MLVAVVVALLALTALGTGAAVVVASRGSAPTKPPARTVVVSCRSPALGGTLPAQVYLPAGYRDGSGRYRVVYFLHGLPAGPDSYKSNAFVASAVAPGRRTIVVAPQGSRGADSDREYLDWGPAENWPEAIAHDLPHCIDKRFRTVANRFGRALIGLSAGGYGAFNIGLRHLDMFAAVESWSGYFRATDPSGEHVLDLGSDQANGEARVPTGADLKTQENTWPSLIAFYIGSQDSRFLEMNKEFEADLQHNGISHVFRVYAGGHTAGLWHAQAGPWLDTALSYLTGSRRRGR
jgi:S-formylglutathione hydrolase FrmB